MLFLFYFQSHHCERQSIDWSLLGVRNRTQLQPFVPETTELVTRTFTLAIFGLIVNILVCLAAALILRKRITRRMFGLYLSFEFQSI